MLELLDRALRYASIHHDHHYRKNDEKTPYIYHPTMTAFYLMKYGFDESIIAASVLHDTVEDTTATLESIRKNFGEKIHEMVKYCTENKKLSWDERKQSQIEGIKKYDHKILVLKLADKLHNLSDLYREYKVNGDDVFTKFNRGYDKQKWYYRGLLNSFASRDEINTHPMFVEFKDIVNVIYPED